MPRNGSGSFSLVTNSWNPATNGNSATAADWQALINDVASAIQGSVASDGETPMTGNLQMGNNKATGLAAATTLGDALRLENLIAGSDIASATTVTIPLEGNCFTITGTTGIAGFSSSRNGRTVWVRFSGILTLTNSTSFQTNTGANVTTSAGDISCWLYDGTNWICALYKAAVPSFSFGFKNRIINGAFTVNQRVYATGVAKTVGTYMHDRWKAGASGCTYSFSAGSAGVPVTITITAGSLQQVIEGCNLPEGGTYTFSWTGTAQGKIAGGSYAASPITITGATAGANCTVEFSTGTVGLVQVEPGGAATTFDYRDFTRELSMCQRYFEKSYQLSSAPGSACGWAAMLWASNGGAVDIYCLVATTFKVQKRTTPTIAYWDSAGNASMSSIVSGGGLAQTNNASLVNSINANDSQMTMAILTNATYNAGSAWTASAEL